MAAETTIQVFRAAHSAGLEAAALEVLRSGQIASGPAVRRFESALEAVVGRPRLVATDNMTSALTLALHLAGVGPGDQVATLAFSCLSSNSAIARVGATPLWVDIDPDTAAMSVEDLARAITPKTRAVTMYHVAGYPGAAQEVAALCRDRGIAFIEDCNSALGAMRNGQPVGKLGDFAVWSFYPNRNVNGAEGGALACPDDDTYDRALRLRRFGIDLGRFRDALGEIDPQCDVPEIGWSSSMSHLHAAIALADLPALDERLRRVRASATMLRSGCVALQGLTPVSPVDGSDPAYWAFLMLAARRDETLRALAALGVKSTRLHHRNDCYTGFRSARRSLPGTDDFMSRVLAVPCGWWLDRADVERLVHALSVATR